MEDASSTQSGTRQRIGLWLGPALAVLVWALPLGLPVPAHRLAGVMAWVMCYWITEAIPLAVTALMGPAVSVLIGVAPAKEAFAPFGDPVIFLFLGSFILAEALSVHQLDKRLALGILGLRGVTSSTAAIRIALGLITAGISMWVNNTATAAMMLPIGLGVARALKAAGSNETPRGLLLMIGIAASLGGIATPVGTAPNLIALGFLENLAGREISFLQFMALGLPLSLVLLTVTYFATRRLVPLGSPGDLRGFVEIERSVLPPWGGAQRACALVFGLAVFFWLLPGVITALGYRTGLLGRVAAIDEAVVAVLAAVALFLWPAGGVRVLDWKAAARIDWGTLLLFGGGLSLGKLMFDSGLAATLGRGAVTATGVTDVWGLTALALVTTILLTEVTSNTATVSMLSPLVLSLAKDLGVPMVPPLLAVCFGASMGFMFPMGTPPNAIVYATGFIPLPVMMRVGIVIDFLSFFVIFAALRTLCPLFGLM
jgi:solute carrier family 13 (sodium-dependent dicarboxylate transporter), member 2/3/5